MLCAQNKTSPEELNTSCASWSYAPTTQLQHLWPSLHHDLREHAKDVSENPVSVSKDNTLFPVRIHSYNPVQADCLPNCYLLKEALLATTSDDCWQAS